MSEDGDDLITFTRRNFLKKLSHNLTATAIITGAATPVSIIAAKDFHEIKKKNKEIVLNPNSSPQQKDKAREEIALNLESRALAAGGICAALTAVGAILANDVRKRANNIDNKPHDRQR